MNVRNDLNTNPYSVGEQVRRVLWGVVQATVFRGSPRPFRGWRRFLLRAFGATIARGAAFHPTVRVEFPWRLRVGEYASFGREVWIYNVGDVDIGAHVTVSARTTLCSGGHNLDDPATPLTRDPITLEDGVWIGMEAFVGPGVRIGAQSVIGAKSAVFKDLPGGMVCYGHPCEVRKPRGA